MYIPFHFFSLMKNNDNYCYDHEDEDDDNEENEDNDVHNVGCTKFYTFLEIQSEPSFLENLL